ncbi:MAG: DNA methyltransferase, partial [Candidatus Binataceae bacterium]
MPRLSEQEQQEVVRYIEAGKPLPDRFRFLLFEDKREVELVWNGKTDEVCNIVLPFQVIEQVDEPRAEKPEHTALQADFFSTDARGRQLKGWTNKLIWGDNKLILSSLKNGPLREEIDKQGGLKLIYIDPPFDVGADFSMDIEIGDDTFTKQPSILEEIAYRDTWGKGADSFIAMIYERLILMRDLLAENGSIYVHCDYRVSGYIRVMLDEVFGKEAIRNHILYLYSGGGIPSSEMPKKHDDIFWYSRGDKWIYNPQYREYSEGTQQRGRTAVKGENARLREEGTPINNWWADVKKITSPTDPEKLYYPTQKSEQLLERILELSSNEGDLLADFFGGSGTTAAVAEKIGRKWIVADLGKFAIHTTRKRLIGVQRGLKAEGKDYRAFEILNLGKYERQHYIGVNPNLREAEQQKQLEEKVAAFVDLILR